jgi:glycosyltransferase involved in cell wall biosynthesis
VAIVTPAFPPAPSGVGDHTAMLGEAFAARGIGVLIFTTRREVEAGASSLVRVLPIVDRWTGPAMWALARRIARARPDVVFLQYVPTLYGRGGVGAAAPSLAWLLRLRGLQVVTILHEPYIPLRFTPKLLAIGLAQRAMLASTMAASCTVAASTLRVAQMTARWLPWRQRDIRRVPVGSNIPPVPLADSVRAALRERLGIAPDEIVLIFFGSLHVTKLLDLILRSPAHLEACAIPAALLVIGQNEATIAARAATMGIPLGRVICTGYCTAEQVSRFLTCGDIFLAPLLDGVSTRRGSVMAALEHGIPVVTTSGHSTEPDLFEGSMCLIPCSEERAFLRAVEDLARDPAARDRLGRAGQALYENVFEWRRIARQLLDLAEPVRSSAREGQ